jgi:hypothetical protein
MDYKNYTLEQVRNAIKNNYSWRQTIFSLGLNGDAGTNNRTLKKIAAENNIDYSHFSGQGWAKSKIKKAIPLLELLINGKLSRSLYLKKRLIKEGILENKCAICGLYDEWNNKKIELQLDHIDGNRFNNTLENLRILCPNCHSQTDTFCGKKEKIIRKCNQCEKKISKSSETGLCCSCAAKNRYKKEFDPNIYKCSKCGKGIAGKGKTGLCLNCVNYKNRIIEHPSIEILLKEIEETNFCVVGRKYGVSDNTIRKWIGIKK